MTQLIDQPINTRSQQRKAKQITWLQMPSSSATGIHHYYQTIPVGSESHYAMGNGFHPQKHPVC